jgi:glycosyltransferase involved in cell wall biosynthesis
MTSHVRIGINAHLLAFTANYRQAGLSRHICELLLRVPVVEPRWHFTAFVGNGRVPHSFLSAKPGNLRLSASHLPTSKPPVRIMWEQAALPIATMRERLDLLHCPVNVRPVLFCACPVVVTVHDLIFLLYPRNFHPAKRLYLTVATGHSVRRAARVIAVSEATRKDLIRLLGVKPERVVTVYNGVGEQFRPLDEDVLGEFAARQGIKGRVVLYVGTLEPRKNLIMLIRAFRRLTDNPALEDVTLLIVGSKGWYYDEIFAAADQSGLVESGRVRFLGRVPEEHLPLWYNISSAFVYPSKYEGFGLPALEAMACGTPVIASNTSSLPEVLGEAGILLDPDDVGAWAQAMERVLVDEPLARQMRHKGLRQAGKFSWQRTAQHTAAVYRQVLGWGRT